MRTINVNKHKVEIYDTAERMTMKRYQRFNKFLMIDNEVGSDFADFNSRLSKAIAFLKKGMKDEGVAELGNWRQMVFNAFTEYSPKGMALALLVHSIDGEERNDITASGLQETLDRLEAIGFTQETATETVSEVKKK
jgi:hypothetical protein